MSSLRLLHTGIWTRPGTSGRTVALVGGMHGDEPEGAVAIQALVDDPSPLAGCPHRILLILGNPDALALGTRHTPDGEDLNRLFGPHIPQGSSPETTRAHLLRALLKDVDRLLDIHTTQHPIQPLAVCRDSPAHLAALAGLGLRHAVVGADRIYGRTMLADWVDGQGGVGLTVEAGQSGTPEASAMARSISASFFASTPAGDAPQVFEIQAPLPSPGAGLRFVRNLANGDGIKAGEILGHSAAGELLSPQDATIFLPREEAEPGTPCMLLAVLR